MSAAGGCEQRKCLAAEGPFVKASASYIALCGSGSAGLGIYYSRKSVSWISLGNQPKYSIVKRLLVRKASIVSILHEFN